VYALVIGKSGPKLKVVSMPIPGFGMESGHLETGPDQGVPISALASALEGQLGRPVLDQTGLKGFYEFALNWTPDNSLADALPGPSLFTAVQEQLGLRLESTKGPVEVLVIDHAEKPDTN
jgi:uncharacterized protein (TIGR03435 family)